MAATRVQTASANGGGYINQIVLPFGSNNTAGNLIVLALAFDPAGAPTSISDTNTNTYNLLQDGNGGRLYYAYNIASGSNSVTIDFPSYQDVMVIAREYSGIITSDPLDVTAENTEAGYFALHSTGTTAATSQATELACAMYRASGNIAGVITISGWSNVTIQDGSDLWTGLAFADKDLTSTGAQSGEWNTDPDYHQGEGAIATFKETLPSNRKSNFMALGVA